ncbi:molybdopterin biosynthesis protein CNX1 [Caerostris darwini]|uniref:molybdopterin molybdotransferase n=1 Tax=Caerostris darwini TaxID=1538125 RepID=A0AAV4WAR4_9ARAC|nr:molybdopterin biosynthesis protein CNX1 [Caerostris darwini]
MATETANQGYSVLVLVISDTVSTGKKQDSSGCNLVSILNSNKYFPVISVEMICVPDEFQDIKKALEMWVDVNNVDLILTVGGTGFTQRDITPEVTKTVIDREAPHLASRMILACCEKSKFAVLSRSVCGMRHQSLILNLPGSVKGSTECFEAIASVLPHAMDQLKGKTKHVASTHAEIQKFLIIEQFINILMKCNMNNPAKAKMQNSCSPKDDSSYGLSHPYIQRLKYDP